MKTCVLLSVLCVGDGIEQVTVSVGKMRVRKKQKAEDCLWSRRVSSGCLCLVQDPTLPFCQELGFFLTE